MEQWVAKKNAYLAAHPRAQAAVALRECHTKLVRLKIDDWLTGKSRSARYAYGCMRKRNARPRSWTGCYVLKTDCRRR